LPLPARDLGIEPMIYRYYPSLLLSLLLLAPCAAALGADGDSEYKDGKWVRTAAPAAGTPAGELALIRQYVEAGKPAKAVGAAEKFMERYPEDPSAEEVMWVAGNAEMSRDRYYQAFEWFSKQLKQAPSGARSEPALLREYKIADAFLQGKKRVVLGFLHLPAQDEGLEILEKVAEQAPGTNVAERALLRIGEYHFMKGEWAEAAQAYDHYMELFKNSPKTRFASLQAARATYSSFRGIAFDSAPLLDAEQRFRTFTQQYPESARQENIGAVVEGIIRTRGDKEYATARFYERTGHPSAALYYYRSVIDLYPQSDAARQAKGDIARLGASATAPRVDAPVRVAPPNPKPVPLEKPAPAPATQEGKTKP
jgi:outer membrane assembly lipoprotein YfiO